MWELLTCGGDIHVWELLKCGGDIHVWELLTSGGDIHVWELLTCGGDIHVWELLTCGRDIHVWEPHVNSHEPHRSCMVAIPELYDSHMGMPLLPCMLVLLCMVAVWELLCTT